jgi:GNAT acetyltransferase-like protein
VVNASTYAYDMTASCVQGRSVGTVSSFRRRGASAAGSAFFGTALSAQHPPLSDGVVELRPIEKRDLDTIKRAARDPEIRRRFGLLKARPREYFARYMELSRAGTGAAFAICVVGGECFGLVTVELRDAGRAELGYCYCRRAEVGDARAATGVALGAEPAGRRPTRARNISGKQGVATSGRAQRLPP